MVDIKRKIILIVILLSVVFFCQTFRGLGSMMRVDSGESSDKMSFNRKTTLANNEKRQRNGGNSTEIDGGDVINYRSGINSKDGAWIENMIYDLRIIVIVYDRRNSLLRLLESLNIAEYGVATVKLEVWIDRSDKNEVDVTVLEAAKNFAFKHGQYEVKVHPRHVGIYGQWLTTWKPMANSSEIAVILEDDLTVSKYFWKYLKLVHEKYDGRRYVSGYSLQGYTSTFNEFSQTKILKAPESSIVFLFPVVGAWGFSPNNKNWRQFLDWFETQDRTKMKPYVPGNIATKWYKELFKKTGGNSMWTMWHIYYAWKNNEFTMYCNFPGHSGMTANWQEKGLHTPVAGGQSNKLITVWKTDYEKLSEDVPYFDIGGNMIGYKK